MTHEVIAVRRTSSIPTALAYLVAHLVAACGSDTPRTPPDAGGNTSALPLCSSLTAAADGVRSSSCPRATTTVTQVAYDATGARASYVFLISCGTTNVAHGTWSQAGGLTCEPGAYTLCDGGPCPPESALDCATSVNCLQLGQCGYVDGTCVLTDEGCAQSAIPCGLGGACHLGSTGTCEVTSDADCRGTCTGCSFKGPCVSQGKCVAAGGGCVARADADCRKSEQCTFAGLCSLEGDACIAKTDADCAPSEVCTLSGQCAAVSGICAVR